MNAQIEIKHLLPAWQRFRSATDIAPIRNKTHYRRMVKTLEALLELTAGDESHPLMELVDIVGNLVEDYEAAHDALPETSGLEALRFLIEQHGLKQNELPEIGSQGVVSEVLTGKRELNVRQIRALAQRFSVSPATFI